MARKKTYVVAALIAAFLSAGCATEMHIVCKGKGTVTVTVPMGAGMISGDCGDGFEYERKLMK